MSALNRHLSRLRKFPRLLLKRFMTGLLRFLMISNRPARWARSGFVLPTTVLLLLVVTLSAGALTYRSFSRSDQVIAMREQKVITNAATPAVDRARAKIEYSFQKDDRVPGGLPSSDVLKALMIAPDVDLDGDGDEDVNFGVLSKGEDIYTLPDETRIDINGDGVTDNAWVFPADINGDGVLAEDGSELIAYSILVDDENELPDGSATPVVIDAESQEKANALVTRTGPISSAKLSSRCRSSRQPEGGWQIVNASKDTLQKNFQVDALVLNRGDEAKSNRTLQTLEFQQSREASRGSKWGAWFRYDLEVFPGPEFKWNGAMHTDGNFFVADNFTGYMVSSNYSCIYSQSASEITIDEDDTFEGQFVRGLMTFNSFIRRTNTPEFHYYNGAAAFPLVDSNGLRLSDNQNTASTRDSVSSVSGQTPTLQDIALNPIKLYTEGVSEHINESTWQRDPNWATSNPVTRQRIYNKDERQPFVDDFFRADNRWGPSPVYRNYNLKEINADDSDITVGTDIDADDFPGMTDGEALDGYWERQAQATGLRLIVGQRLELGNAAGWNVDPTTGTRAAYVPGDTNLRKGDPLYPPISSEGSLASLPAEGNTTALRQYQGGIHEVIQRKSLRDNLAAVQSMAVYHYETEDGAFPLACMAMTAHPGTPETIVKSRTFGTYATGEVKTDFFNGEGTNGWEFHFPDSFDTESEFGNQLGSSDALGIALRNLAHFAGDPYGGAPSFQPIQDSDDGNNSNDAESSVGPAVHPYPYLSMWGDFSQLRRIFEEYLDNGVTYSELSPADKTTLHTAACTLGMLAYHMGEEEASFDLTYNDRLSGFFTSNGQVLARFFDQQVNNNNGELTQVYTEQTFRDGTTNPYYNSLYNPSTSAYDTATKRMDAYYSTWVDPTPNTGVINVASSTDANGDGDYTDAGDTLVWSCDPSTDLAGYQPTCDAGTLASQFNLDQWIAAYRIIETDANSDEFEELITAIAAGAALDRDRTFGFREGILPSALLGDFGDDITWDPINGYTQPVTIPGGTSLAFRTGCDPNDFFGQLSGGGAGASARDAVVLSVIVCGEEIPVKYPSLYYLFPRFDHDHDGDDDTGADGVLDAGVAGVDHAQPDTGFTTQAEEEYITDEFIQAVNPLGEDGVIYQVVGADESGFADIALVPGAEDRSDWVLPNASATGTGAALTTSNLNNTSHAFRINLPSGAADVAFLDKAFFDGREQMNVRFLDIDIGRLATDTNESDYWLADDETANGEGIVYAFREDAVREDEIVRPVNSGATVADCTVLASGVTNPRKFTLETDEVCRMEVDPSDKGGTDSSDTDGNDIVFQDPPLTDVRISLKPVDFYPDPDRRAYGFRLRNGADISDDLDRDAGMTFITDNSVYIMGDFNLHSDDGTVSGLIEEFTDTLYDDDWDEEDFYGRPAGTGRIESELNTDEEFALTTFDHWRPVEILADAIGIFSNNFVDGSVREGFVQATPSGNYAGTASYQNQNRPYFDSSDAANYTLARWVQEEEWTGAAEEYGSPVWIDRNGEYLVKNASGTPGEVTEYISFSNSTLRPRNLSVATETYVNATMVSGIVPSRPYQSYGGFHNFPRFLESWSNSSGTLFDLNISGAFLQLNFSNAATAPFDQDAWERGESSIAPTSSTDLKTYNDFYNPPTRRWGYDVALQYAPPAPLSRRFITFGTPRSEYYRELPADDPYIVLLRCAEYEDGTRVDPLVDGEQCPSY